MAEGEKAPLLRELGFVHFDREDGRGLPTVTGELIFVSIGGIVELTFAIDEMGQHWVNPRNIVDLSAWGFTPLEEYMRKKNTPQ